MKKIALFSLVTLTFIYAETTPIKTHVELSYVSTAGNTDTKNFATKIDAQKVLNSITLIAKANSLLAKDGDTETSNKTILTLKCEKAFDSKLFGYLEANYIRDKFSGYEYRANIGPGIGYKILQNDTHNLKLGFGSSYAKDKDYQIGVTDDYISANTELNYDMRINEQVTFKQDVIYTTSFDDRDKYFTTSLTGVNVKMNSKISLGVSYKMEYQNLLPSVGLEHIDKTFLTSLIIDF